MLKLEARVLGKLSDARLLNHFRTCQTYIRDTYRDYHHYDYPLNEKEKIQLALDEGYAETVRMLLSTRKHVPRKAK